MIVHRRPKSWLIMLFAWRGTALQRIWKRPVHLETVVFERRKILSFDGKEHTRREVKS